MTEPWGWLPCGVIGFLAVQLRWRWTSEFPERALLLWSGIALLFLVPYGIDFAVLDGEFAPLARVLTFYVGVVLGYGIYVRFWRRRVQDPSTARRDSAA